MATSYANPGGSGFRKHLIAMTSDWPWWGDKYNLIDGINDAGTFYLTGGSNVNKYCTFDFGVPCIVDEITFYQSGAADHGLFKAQGSNDGSSWYDIGSNFHLGGETNPYVITGLAGNTTAYRYLKLVGISGSFNGGPWTREMEFKITFDPDNTGPSYGKPGGCLDRTSIITVTQSEDLFDVHNSGMYSLVDNLFLVPSAIYFNINGAASGKWFKFDFGSPKVIDEAIFIQSTSDSHGTWQWQGSNDDSNWVDVGSSFTLGGAPISTHTSLNGNTVGYRYWRVLGVSGSYSVSPFIYEMCFRINDVPSDFPPDNCLSLTFCPGTPIPLGPPASALSLTACEAIGLPHLEPLLSLTFCKSPTSGGPDNILSLTFCPDIPLTYGAGTFMIF